MFSVPKCRLVTVLVLVFLHCQVRGSDPGRAPGDRSTFVPIKSSRSQDRASEFVQRFPKLVRSDGEKKESPKRAGYIYKMEP